MSGDQVAQSLNAPGRDRALRHPDYDRPGRAGPGSLQLMNLLYDYRRPRRASFIGEFEFPLDQHDFIGLKKVLVLVELFRPTNYFNRTILVFQAEQSETVSFLSDLSHEFDDDPSQRDLVSVRRLLYVAAVEARQALDRFSVILQRMATGVKSQRLFLQGQALFPAPLRNGWKRRLLYSRAHHVAEQSCLSGEFVALSPGAI